MKPTQLTDTTMVYTPAELASVIAILSDSADTAGTELLKEFVGVALHRIQTATVKSDCLGLIAELTEVERKRLLPLPYSMVPLLKEAIADARHNPGLDHRDLIFPLLTLNLREPSDLLEREATRIIRRCHRNAQNNPASTNPEINRDRQIALEYIDYV